MSDKDDQRGRISYQQVVDNGVPPIFADTFSELSVKDGVFSVAFISAARIMDGPVKAVVNQRTRFGVETATRLRDALTLMLNDHHAAAAGDNSAPRSEPIN